MFGNTTKIIETLATIKADTANHKEDLQELKTTSIDLNKKIDAVSCKLSNMECPYDERIGKIEDSQLDHERANRDNEKTVATEISSLKARSKYNLLSMAGLWTLLGVILKKIFTS